jgi:hypothetical protein
MQMSELFNQRNALTGKIPSGVFNSSFDLESSSWAEDAAAIKCLAFDGYFIPLLDLRLDCRPLALADHVVRDVPATWDPSAIARYGNWRPYGLLPCTVPYRVSPLAMTLMLLSLPSTKFSATRLPCCVKKPVCVVENGPDHVANCRKNTKLPAGLDSFQSLPDL